MVERLTRKEFNLFDQLLIKRHTNHLVHEYVL